MAFVDYTSSVTRSVQSNDYRCGAACCVMALSHYNFPISEDQADADIRVGEQEPADWYADPAGVARCLGMDRVPDPIDFEITVHTDNDIPSAYGKIAQTLIERRMPCLALVYAGAHWVVIESIRVDDASPNREIVGFSIVDPYSSEPARRFVPAIMFESRYFQKVEYGHIWESKYVVIGDAVTNYQPSNSAVVAMKASLNIFAAPLDAQLVVDYTTATNALSSYGFNDVRKYLDGGAPFPLKRVQSLEGAHIFDIMFVDATNDSYFTGPACVALDASTGALLEATPDYAGYLANDGEVVEAADAHFSVEGYDLNPEYYWIESPLSRSRFSLIRKATRDGTTYYIFANGTISTAVPTFSTGA